MSAPHPPAPSPSPGHPMPSEEQTNPEIRAVTSRFRVLMTFIGGGFTLISLGGVALAYDKLEAKAADAGTQAAKVETAPVVEAVKAHEARLQAIEQRTGRTEADVHEARGELRDLYKAVMEGKRSERLERPLPPIQTDGGRP